jgi:hypothetical protein
VNPLAQLISRLDVAEDQARLRRQRDSIRREIELPVADVREPLRRRESVLARAELAKQQQRVERDRDALADLVEQLLLLAAEDPRVRALMNSERVWL